uniref:Uncharacterized protein n=1 Tax=Pyxicephalus adspersus TaxID=30357 RepID=A0AAV3B6C9_PYXAD|nr:TPA: hypothetical protein GDO54_001456 [Pyxicephalus adspersus]
MCSYNTLSVCKAMSLTACIQITYQSSQLESECISLTGKKIRNKYKKKIKNKKKCTCENLFILKARLQKILVTVIESSITFTVLRNI